MVDWLNLDGVYKILADERHLRERSFDGVGKIGSNIV
jgi:hypothetical protein